MLYFMLRRLGPALCLALPLLAAQAAPSDQAAAPATALTHPQVLLVSGPEARLSRAEVERAVALRVPADDQAGFWFSGQAVHRFVQSLYANRALANRGRAAGLQADSDLAEPTEQDLELAYRYVATQIAEEAPDLAALDAYARSEHRANPERFTRPEARRLRHILVAVPRGANEEDAEAVRQRAAELRQQLQAGADFAQLARQQSDDPGSAARGGELDWVEPGRTVLPFEQASFALNTPGELSAPVRTEFGWHIIELLELRPAQLQPFEEVAPQLHQEALQRLEQRAQRRLWDEVRAQAELNDKALGVLMREKTAPLLEGVKPR